ncbi:hypothetical protein SAZ_03870 [Streptomyces noursei ZPM]|nr:hypothetical protein SAZ_03870 [Streptomyces noursei ZPM]EPY92797.1 hypothetical protein K530_51400 [Streptomyces noursei CCRC 11814]
MTKPLHAEAPLDPLVAASWGSRRGSRSADNGAAGRSDSQCRLIMQANTAVYEEA